MSGRLLRRPRLRTVLLLVNLLILLLPLGGIAALGLYESELTRGTEAELLAQGALVRGLFREAYLRAAGQPGLQGASSRSASGTIDAPEVLTPTLDTSRDSIAPRPPPAIAPGVPADPVGVAAGAAIEPVIEAAARETLTGIRIVDRSGIVVASTGTEKGMSIAAREEVAGALQGRRVSLLRQRISDEPPPRLASLSRGQRYRVVVALPVAVEGRGVIGAVVLVRTPLDIAKALYVNRKPLLVGAVALLAVVVAVSTLTSLTIVRPARRLMERAERVARGERDVAVEIPEPGTREMAHLSRTISAMARSLEQRADTIRSFASHVSHEFKTPLSTIRATSELLRDHVATMTSDERDRFLTILDESAERLERLVRRLLELARADVSRPSDDRADVSAVLSEAAEKARGAGLPVELSVSSDVGTIRMGRETLLEILGNLLDNARVHGGPSVTARLLARLDRSSSPPEVEISVVDDGPGISEANSGRVFTPFFTTARERGGSGLGLSIVRTLCEAHGGSIRLEDRSARVGQELAAGSPERADSGATFVLRIPSDP